MIKHEWQLNTNVVTVENIEKLQSSTVGKQIFSPSLGKRRRVLFSKATLWWVLPDVTVIQSCRLWYSHKTEQIKWQSNGGEYIVTKSNGGSEAAWITGTGPNLVCSFCVLRAKLAPVYTSTELVTNIFPILSIFALDMLTQMLDKSDGKAGSQQNPWEKRENATEPLNHLEFA